MVQVVKEQKISSPYIREAETISEIKETLEQILYVPDDHIRPKIIEELCRYLRDKRSDPEYNIKAIIANHNSEVCGFVIAQIDPYYTSYSRKCGTFGWLHAQTYDICKQLLKECETFIRANKIRKIRGNINFPKNLGGIGIQVAGFEQRMLHGVAYTDPQSKILTYLDRLGYQKESNYVCVQVEQKTWDKGKKIDRDIEFRYMTLHKLYDYADEIRNLANNSFHEILPDSSGRNRIYEFFDAFSQVPQSFHKLPEGFNPRTYCDVPQFIEAWETCDLEKIEIWAPMAFNKKTGELAGILLGLPDLFQTWRGEPITRANVDTAMVKKGYFGKGIFSALNNIGQLIGRLFGIEYYEGTTIWANNSRAVDTIFPHCRPIRQHIVVQKRL